MCVPSDGSEEVLWKERNVYVAAFFLSKDRAIATSPNTEEGALYRNLSASNLLATLTLKTTGSFHH